MMLMMSQLMLMVAGWRCSWHLGCAKLSMKSQGTVFSSAHQ